MVRPRRAMSGTFTDKIKLYMPTIAILLGGIAIGYLARKPIAKLVGKVT